MSATVSVVLNLLNALFVAGAVYAHLRKNTFAAVMKYFTVLSNLFCAVASLAVAVARLSGSVPQGVLLLKYVGTSAVTVTLLTVLFFLGPAYGYQFLLSGPDLWLHLICPVLAIVSYLVWDQPSAGFGVVFLGMLPVILYGLVYLNRVVLMPGEPRWEDFYGFNKNGKWYISVMAMLAAAFLISLALWLA